MPRTARAAAGGVIYHVLNRGNGRMQIFRKPADYLAFVALLAEALSRTPGIELYAFCLMPNHWHMVVRPRGDRDLALFMAWITNTHVKRYRAHYRRTSGHLYQGRFKSFPVERDEHLLAVLRYVEANPLRARLARPSQEWTWCSLSTPIDPASGATIVSDWPIERPKNWKSLVNESQPAVVVERLRTSITRDRPFGSATWTTRMAARMGLTHTLRPRGRPRKTPQRER